MKCPGCGTQLKWSDGAFCPACMAPKSPLPDGKAMPCTEGQPLPDVVALQTRVSDLGTQVTSLQTVNGVLRDRIAELERDLAAAREEGVRLLKARVSECTALRAAIDAAVVELLAKPQLGVFVTPRPHISLRAERAYEILTAQSEVYK